MVREQTNFATTHFVASSFPFRQEKSAPMDGLRLRPGIRSTIVQSHGYCAPILPDHLPWHRVLGAGGEIKLRYQAAKEQKARLRMEGVKFRGTHVDMERFEHAIRAWDTFD
jgi:hypothetical protein